MARPKPPSVGKGPKPMSRQRSEWTQVDSDPAMVLGLHLTGGRMIGAWQRNVSDGHLTVFVTDDGDVAGDGTRHLHLSISHRTNTKPPRPGRYPRWDEIADARYKLLPDDVHFAMVLPPPDSYVAHHDTTFHLHETTDPHLTRAGA